MHVQYMCVGRARTYMHTHTFTHTNTHILFQMFPWVKYVLIIFGIVAVSGPEQVHSFANVSVQAHGTIFYLSSLLEVPIGRF